MKVFDKSTDKQSDIKKHVSYMLGKCYPFVCKSPEADLVSQKLFLIVLSNVILFASKETTISEQPHRGVLLSAPAIREGRYQHPGARSDV